MLPSLAGSVSLLVPPLHCLGAPGLTSCSSDILILATDEPEVTIEGFDGNWYLQRMDVKLTCKADANPPATEYHWTT